MKNKISIIITFILLVSLTSCDMFINKDTTGNVSYVSTKPTITLLGDPIMELTVGDSYSDPGVQAFSTPDSLIDAEIVSGVVDANTEGFYVVTYKAANGFNWASYEYRAVLVHDGSPYSGEIAGTFRIGFKFYSEISKHSIDGYWQMDNVFAEEGVDFPIVFADMGDGINYTVVPGEHISKGNYSGVGVKITGGIKFTLTLLDADGNTTIKNFEWTAS